VFLESCSWKKKVTDGGLFGHYKRSPAENVGKPEKRSRALAIVESRPMLGLFGCCKNGDEFTHCIPFHFSTRKWLFSYPHLEDKRDAGVI